MFTIKRKSKLLILFISFPHLKEENKFIHKAQLEIFNERFYEEKKIGFAFQSDAS